MTHELPVWSDFSPASRRLRQSELDAAGRRIQGSSGYPASQLSSGSSEGGLPPAWGLERRTPVA
jgi:hypothetical protein